MTTTGPVGVQARVTGAVNGQLAVGNNIVQYNVAAGGVVYHAKPGEVPAPNLRSTVPIRGRPPKLVGRARELEAAFAVLSPDDPVEFHGVAGVGKSALLKHVGHHPPSSELASAVAYHACGVETVEETLQFLFEAFYETAGPYKPTRGELPILLAEVRGLVLLDDVTLERTDVDAVLDALPEATFLLASERRRLWGQGKALAVRGLDEDEAIALLERKLGRPVTGEEQAAARDACRALEGHPLRLEQLASLVEQLGESVTDAAPVGEDGPPVDLLVGRLKSRLEPEQLQVLAALGAVLGASLSAEHLGALVGVPDVAAVVEPLLRSGLVQAHSPRYSLREARAAVGDSADWAHRVADHLATEGEAGDDPEPVAEEAGAILTLLGRFRADGDHRTLLRLSRSTERALMLGRRWGAWRLALEDQLAASRALGDRRSEAWALHQLGTRALCLGDDVVARGSLTQALAIRERIGDRIGAEATRHNLDLLAPPPPPPPPPARPTPPPPESPWRRPSPAPVPAAPPDRTKSPVMWWAAGAVVLLLVLGLVATTLVGGGTDSENTGFGQSTTVPGTPGSTQPPVAPTGAVAAEPASLRFEDQPVGTASLPRMVTFANGTRSPIRPTGVTVDGAGRDSFTVAAGTCAGATVPAGGRCTVDVVFRPPAVGDRAATLRLVAEGAPAVALAGRGVESAEDEIRLDPEVVTFGDQGVGTSGPAATVRVTNVSSSRVTVQDVSVSSVDDFTVDAAGCRGDALSRGTSCALTVTFRPIAAGDRRATLFVTTSAGVAVGTLQGRGLAATALAAQADLALRSTFRECDGVQFCLVEITVTNNGPSPATGVTVAIELLRARATDGVDPDPRCSPTSCALGTLQPREPATFRYVADFTGSPASLTATARAAEPDPDGSNNSRTTDLIFASPLFVGPTTTVETPS